MTESAITTRTARSEELDTVVDLCLDAFADEAVLSWVIPDPAERRPYMRQMFSTSLDAVVAADAMILAIDAAGEAVGFSIWLPHTATSEEPGETPSTDERDPQARRAATLEAATSARRPAIPHLKLDSMAAPPEHRGKGAGSAMLSAGLERAQMLGLPVYLEASTSDNRRLYERVGFRDLGDPIDLPDGGPSLQPMWHEPH